MIDYVNDVLSLLDKVQGLSSAGLTCLVCIVVGYALRPWKWFPNQAIPVVVILFGGIMYSMMADPKVATVPFRVWLTRNIAIGWAIGFIAWMIHYWGLSYLENYLVKKFGAKPPIDEDSKQQPEQIGDNKNEKGN